jgi:exopolysaccharide production protein ExoQ
MLILKYLPQALAFVLMLLLSLMGAPFPQLRVLAMLGVIALLTLYRRDAALEVLFRWWPLLLLPVIAIASAMWSTAPQASIRYGLQFLITVYAGILLAKTVSARNLIIALAGALLVYCVLCIIDGTLGPSQRGMVIVGYSGSKNAMAAFAMLLLLSSLTMLMMGGMSLWVRLMGLLALPMAGFFLLQSHSTGATVVAIGGAGLLVTFWLCQRLTPSLRLAAAAALIVVASPLTLLTPEAVEGYDHFLYDVLGKDPTLSGRAALWERADALIAERPWLGHGYRAVWMGQGTETEALQRLTGVDDLRSFNFHDHFRQVRVDLGYLGIAAFIGAALATLIAAIVLFVARPTAAISFFLVYFLATVTRAPFEALLGPFSQGTILFYAACTYAIQGAVALRHAETSSLSPAGATPRTRSSVA